MRHLIEVRNLTKLYGKRIAVDSLSFSVSSGEILGLLGPNGAGKTTSLRLLAGIIAPSSGEATVAGVPTGETTRLHASIGFLPETPGFYERLTAWDNLLFFGRFYPGIPVEDRVEKTLRVFGLWDRRADRVAAFSRGMKLRLALARTLLPDPEVLLLDEPTGGLDPEAASEVRELGRALRKDNRAIIWATHNLAEAEALCDRVAIIRTKLLAIASPSSLRGGIARPRLRITLEKPETEWVGKAKGIPGVEAAELDGGVLRLAVGENADRPDIVAELVRLGARLLSVEEERPSLEDAYLRLVSEEKTDG